MRHRKTGLKLNRTSSHRLAMFRNMVTSLLKYDRIRTTDAKAKEIRSWADHVITLAKRGDLHARRQALSIVREKNVVHKLFAEVNDRFGEISGGYTRVVKLGIRHGDAAPISIVELVASAAPKKKKTKKKEKMDTGKPLTMEEKAGVLGGVGKVSEADTLEGTAQKAADEAPDILKIQETSSEVILDQTETVNELDGVRASAPRTDVNGKEVSSEIVSHESPDPSDTLKKEQ